MPAEYWLREPHEHITSPTPHRSQRPVGRPASAQTSSMTGVQAAEGSVLISPGAESVLSSLLAPVPVSPLSVLAPEPSTC